MIYVRWLKSDALNVRLLLETMKLAATKNMKATVSDLLVKVRKSRYQRYRVFCNARQEREARKKWGRYISHHHVTFSLRTTRASQAHNLSVIFAPITDLQRGTRGRQKNRRYILIIAEIASWTAKLSKFIIFFIFFPFLFFLLHVQSRECREFRRNESLGVNFLLQII